MPLLVVVAAVGVAFVCGGCWRSVPLRAPGRTKSGCHRSAQQLQQHQQLRCSRRGHGLSKGAYVGYSPRRVRVCVCVCERNTAALYARSVWLNRCRWMPPSFPTAAQRCVAPTPSSHGPAQPSPYCRDCCHCVQCNCCRCCRRAVSAAARAVQGARCQDASCPYTYTGMTVVAAPATVNANPAHALTKRRSKRIPCTTFNTRADCATTGDRQQLPCAAAGCGGAGAAGSFSKPACRAIPKVRRRCCSAARSSRTVSGALRCHALLPRWQPQCTRISYRR